MPLTVQVVADLNGQVAKARALRRQWGDRHGRDAIGSCHYVINAILDGLDVDTAW